MNWEIKDGKHWQRYHKLYPRDNTKSLWFWVLGWLCVVLIWNTSWVPWLSPIFIVWGLFGFQWAVRLVLSKHYFDREEKRKREQTYYF
jgi:hypothetical protein